VVALSEAGLASTAARRSRPAGDHRLAPDGASQPRTLPPVAEAATLPTSHWDCAGSAALNLSLPSSSLPGSCSSCKRPSPWRSVNGSLPGGIALQPSGRSGLELSVAASQSKWQAPVASQARGSRPSSASTWKPLQIQHRPTLAAKPPLPGAGARSGQWRSQAQIIAVAESTRKTTASNPLRSRCFMPQKAGWNSQQSFGGPPARLGPQLEQGK